MDQIDQQAPPQGGRSPSQGVGPKCAVWGGCPQWGPSPAHQVQITSSQAYRHMWLPNLDFQNAFGTMHRKACVEQLEEQLEKHINPQEPWFLATKNLWSRSVAIPQDLEEEIFQTADGVPQGDPLSTLVFATAMSLLVQDRM